MTLHEDALGRTTSCPRGAASTHTVVVIGTRENPAAGAVVLRRWTPDGRERALPPGVKGR